MKLGERVQITIGVADLAASLQFYEQIGFQMLEQNSMPYPWAQLTDGHNLLLLNQDGTTVQGLSYYSPDASERANQLQAHGIQMVEAHPLSNVGSAAASFTDPNGLPVTIIQADIDNMPQVAKEAITRCGKFGEFALAVESFSQTAEFWNGLGFMTLHAEEGGESGENWGILYDGMMVLGLHQTDDFDSINLTYFAPDMAERLANLQADGVEIMAFGSGEEVGGNGVICSPDGHRLFLFEGEIPDPPVLEE